VLARVAGGKPFEPFGKDSDQLKKAETRDDGPTGPATSKSPLRWNCWDRPFSSRPETHGWPALYGFWARWQGKAAGSRGQGAARNRRAAWHERWERCLSAQIGSAVGKVDRLGVDYGSNILK